MWGMLEVQTAYRTLLASQRLIDLGYRLSDASFTKFLGTVKSRQKSAMVFYRLALQHQQAQQRRRDEIKP